MVSFLSNVSWVEVASGLLLFVSSVIISFGLVALVLVRMPAAYFEGPKPPPLLFTNRPPWQRNVATVAKNIAGVLLILLGVVLSVPGIPGQGILTILIGVTLVDIPGKRRFEQRVMRIPAVLDGANRIRRRFGKEPFFVEATQA